MLLANQIVGFLNQPYLQKRSDERVWFFAYWNKFIKIKSWFGIFLDWYSQKWGELWTYFTPCSSVFIVNFEKVNTAWAQEGIHGLTDFLHVDTNSRKLKVTSMIFGVLEVKIGCGVLKFNSKTCCIPKMILMKWADFFSCWWWWNSVWLDWCSYSACLIFGIPFSCTCFVRIYSSVNTFRWWSPFRAFPFVILLVKIGIY